MGYNWRLADPDEVLLAHDIVRFAPGARGARVGITSSNIAAHLKAVESTFYFSYLPQFYISIGRRFVE